MEENKYEELVELIQKWVSEKDLINNLSKSPSNSKNQLIIAKRLASMEPDFLKYSTLNQLKKINPKIAQIIRQTFYEIYFSRKENTGLIGKNVKIDGVEGTIDISLEDCLLNKKEMKAKFGEHVANYLRQCEMRPYGCVRLADQAVNRFYREMQKDSLTSIGDIRKKKGGKG